MFQDVGFVKHYNNHDPNKPNFIFSSDVHEKVRILADRYLTKDKGDCELGEIEFNINIELNVLLVRDRNLRATDLIKDNLVFLAKTSSSVSNVQGIIFNTLKKSIEPYALKSNEIFIANLTLKLLEFKVSDIDHISIDFLKDSSYALLLICDENMLDQLERYFKLKFVQELNKQIEKDVPEGSLVEIPTMVQDISNTDSTLEESDIQLNEKSFIYDDDDFDSSMENLLNSNQTTRSNSNEELPFEDEGINEQTAFKLCQFEQSEQSEQLSEQSIELPTEKLSELSQISEEPSEHSVESINHSIEQQVSDSSPFNSPFNSPFESPFDQPSLSNKPLNTIEKKDFIKNMNNLRHNEEYIKLDDLQEIECNIDEIDQPNPDNTSIDRISVTNRISEINSINRNPTDVSHSSKLDLDALDSKQKDFKDPDFPSLEPGIRLAPSYEMFDNELEEVLTRKASVSSAFVSPSKQKSIPRMGSASFSMINHEDNSGLEYAFRINSPTVPSYIKSDKKFKFIKIGKVQKFVNLFEENDHTSAESSAHTTRASSPIRRDISK